MTQDNIVIINRDEDQSAAETKPVSLSEGIQNLSLFEGEIVAFEGVLEQKRFIAERVMKPKAIFKRKRLMYDDVRIYRI